ncbi:tubulin folding cofactor D C terminal-domain-containing protein [Sordaria brevicollis]|uniref:Tubulin folding cofactor D C terminal-domain-containing protein n=1 Tax=Sordaria brevicollis TaxID=83679 RepID=A0AAE0PE17_SORBR|nr:tubulin folding cofactor D C terminal-domain-containing protein [Sordaria brevicollis]
MDAPDDDLDIKLQKISNDLISDFDASLVPFLRKQNGSGGTVVRSGVRSRELERIIAGLLDPFQELPQLLDPYLPKWLPILAENFLEYQQSRYRNKLLSTRSDLLTPLPRAICKILYTFCKIRGEKVIVRFLNNETKYLELLLAALEESERHQDAHPSSADDTPANAGSGPQWTWEERYIVLLWLSHLMLAPFDLATISSTDAEQDDLVPIPGFQWPQSLPGITTRILPLAIKYLSSPGKERDAAKALLVRVSMRRDMQQLGVLDALVNWALSSLRPQEGVQRTPYHYIGVLSFLSGILVSSIDTSDMNKYLLTLFQEVHGAATSQNAAGSVMSSALARKTMIKVIRSIAVSILRMSSQDMSSMEIIETTIGFLLENLADNDTPVRFAASKALSVITLKLDPDMASEVVEAVIDSLNKNVLWVKDPTDTSAPPAMDISAVDPLEWHGLMLTLSHLLYRRSPPAENLDGIINALLTGLSFERRGTSGGSIGTNVRDAACFGIWALARRYSTKELLAVPTSSTVSTRFYNQQASMLQILATELVVAACLDPSGNIRRGSSAALQELIGRHPDTVEKGIWVVQTVDYHAVARRSRALQEVALNVTRLSGQYGEAILHALLGWRGIGDLDAMARRAAGASFGTIASELALNVSDSAARLTHFLTMILGRIKSLQVRQVEERHGLLVSFSSLLDAFPNVANPSRDVGSITFSSSVFNFISSTIRAITGILTDADTRTYRKPELIAEGASSLIISSFPVLQMSVLSSNDTLPDTSQTTLLPGRALFAKSGTEISDLIAQMTPRPEHVREIAGFAKANLAKWLIRPEQEIITVASEAALVLLIFCEDAERENVVREWADAVRHRPSGRATTASGYFSALAMSYSVLATLKVAEQDRSLMCNAFVERWKIDNDIETRVSILSSLTQSDILRENIDTFLELIAAGLDDYTTNARGDVGSLVRLQAIKATKFLWERLDQLPTNEPFRVVSALFLRILRLAAEKLDKVRAEAQTALALVLKPNCSARVRESTFSSKIYFGFLLDLLFEDFLQPTISDSLKTNPEAWMEELLAGLVSSADTGNEELVIATRAALCDFCQQSQEKTDAVCTALLRNLKSRQGQDRVLVPTLEITAFLLHVGVFQTCAKINYKSLCLQVQKACYKTGNVRKIEACIRVYGAVAELGRQPQGSGRALVDAGTNEQRRQEGIADARKRLGALMMHPWPRIRSFVVDELWGLTSISLDNDPVAQKLKGVDWGKADKGSVKSLVEALELGSS